MVDVINHPADGAVGYVITTPDGETTAALRPQDEAAYAAALPPGWSVKGKVSVVGPAARPAAPAPSRVTKALDFRDRFTQAEKVAIYTAAKSDIQTAIWLDDLSAATTVDLDSPRIAVGLDGMVAAGLLTALRRAAIVA